MDDNATPASEIRTILTSFIADEVSRAGMDNVVLGLSGGIDSSLAAYLAVEALGPEHVLGLVLSYRTSSPESVADAKLVAQKLGIRSEEIDITPMADAFFRDYAPDSSRARRGNVLARLRMVCLFDRSARENGLVLGTSNKTEILLGYGTIHGDLACGINPLGDLYKTQVRELAALVGVPEAIIAKSPSADLWPDQTDEGDLGFTYEEIDKLLYHLGELRRDRTSLLEQGFEPDFIDHVCSLIRESQHKRRLPLIAKVSSGTLGDEFPLSREWGV